MLFFFSCTINTHPSIPPQAEDSIHILQQHVQRIEELSNLILEAQQRNNTESIETLLKEVEQENIMLQKHKMELQENLKYRTP